MAFMQLLRFEFFTEFNTNKFTKQFDSMNLELDRMAARSAVSPGISFESIGLLSFQSLSKHNRNHTSLLPLSAIIVKFRQVVYSCAPFFILFHSNGQKAKLMAFVIVSFLCL